MFSICSLESGGSQGFEERRKVPEFERSHVYDRTDAGTCLVLDIDSLHVDGVVLAEGVDVEDVYIVDVVEIALYLADVAEVVHNVEVLAAVAHDVAIVDVGEAVRAEVDLVAEIARDVDSSALDVEDSVETGTFADSFAFVEDDVAQGPVVVAEVLGVPASVVDSPSVAVVRAVAIVDAAQAVEKAFVDVAAVLDVDALPADAEQIVVVAETVVQTVDVA